jgi:choline dehydrogenase
VRGRLNLTIVTEAFVQRLLVAHGICQGAEDRQCGTTRTAYADGEVVLAADTVATPQLLMLSEIGPGLHLREQGLAVDVDLPAPDRPALPD